ncbi:ribonuclease III [Polycladidibacter hongkongensis]|uniref:ribonuclease III n=1 Tax=Polycladidibacter hongkongensis TaxID=1647556 RepID=UPI000834C2D5|nr:ribonuclease III [Pseudovibrio hongkongensis]
MIKNKKNENDHKLEERIGYTFKDKLLLKRALTHASALPLHAAADSSYQRLEFLGDRVLGLSVATMLEAEYPKAEEGELARRLNQLVKKETCAEVAKEWRLGNHMRVGDAEARSGGRTKAALLADMCESILAAIYLDSGYAEADRITRKFFAPRMKSYAGPLRDAKTTLQEWVQGKGKPTPTYAIIDRKGPDHAPLFVVEVTISDTHPARAEGKSRRAAEQAAATEILVREGVWAES